MSYIRQYQNLKNQFDLNRDHISLDDSHLILRNFEFISEPDKFLLSTENEDAIIEENIKFRYPVIMPEGNTKSKQAIILLHGLNERTWHKHLTGARFLAEKSGKPVLMFPLSFHINRGLPAWTDIRKMTGSLDERKRKYPHVKEASCVNLALSDRLTEYPERFYLSGLQSTMDLIKLIKDIQDGRHPLFEKETRINLFAYSISCMLLQCLIISDRDNILKNSKIVLFAGGSLFSHIQGASRFIMDSVAFESIRKYYMSVFTWKTAQLKELRPWVMEHPFGKAFRSLIIPDFLRKTRSKAFDDFSENMMVISLQDDHIMPQSGIKEAFGERFCQSANFRSIHFPYAYTHENPFPVLYNNIDEQVGAGFHSVFSPTLEFLT